MTIINNLFSNINFLFQHLSLFCRGASQQSLFCTCCNIYCNRCQAPYKCLLLLLLLLLQVVSDHELLTCSLLNAHMLRRTAHLV